MSEVDSDDEPPLHTFFRRLTRHYCSTEQYLFALETVVCPVHVGSSSEPPTPSVSRCSSLAAGGTKVRCGSLLQAVGALNQAVDPQSDPGAASSSSYAAGSSLARSAGSRLCREEPSQGEGRINSPGLLCIAFTVGHSDCTERFAH